MGLFSKTQKYDLKITMRYVSLWDDQTCVFNLDKKEDLVNIIKKYQELLDLKNGEVGGGKITVGSKAGVKYVGDVLGNRLVKLRKTQEELEIFNNRYNGITRATPEGMIEEDIKNHESLIGNIEKIISILPYENISVDQFLDNP